MLGCEAVEAVGLRVRAEDVPASSRWEYWRHITSETFVPFDLRTARAPHRYRGEIVSSALGPAWATVIDGTATEAHRTAALIRRAPAEVYKLEFPLRSRLIGAADDREAVLAPGDFALYDMTRVFGSAPYPAAGSSQEPMRLLGLMIPRTALPLPPALIAELTATPFRGGTGFGRLISSMLIRLAADLDGYAPAEAEAAGRAVVDLLVTAVARRLDREHQVPEHTWRAALLLRVQAFIEEHLADPTLGPGAIAAAHHISPRSLYQLFEHQGTSVAGWIRRRRLEHCRQDLLDPRNASRTAGAIAARWGLRDPAHFSRLFRAAYGLPPGDYRRHFGPGRSAT